MPIDLSRWWSKPQTRAMLLAMASVLPLIVWWLGWFPGLLSSDSVDQFGQARAFDINNAHPAIHTLTIWLATRLWDSPAAVTLLQVFATAGMLGLVARRLTAVGVPWWLAGGAGLAVGLLPPVGAMTIALWKDVPFTLALLWAFAETLLLARDRRAFYDTPWPLIRMGLALGAVWVFRHNGFLTVIPFLVVLGVWAWQGARRGWIAAAAVIGVVIAVNYVIYPLAGVDRTAIEPGAVFVSDVAASLRHEPDNFSQDELSYLNTIAPIGVWTSAYDCRNSTALVFNDAFDRVALDADPGRFRALVIDTVVRDLDTVAGHRWCAADYLIWPAQPESAYFFRPPFVMADNPFGFEFDPVFDTAFEVTLDVVQWAEDPGRLWWVWRPALVVWLGVAIYGLVAWRRRLRPLLLSGGLIACQLLNVAATSPAQEFRFAYGIYLMCLLSAPLLWLVAKPDQAHLSDVGRRGLRLEGVEVGR